MKKANPKTKSELTQSRLQRYQSDIVAFVDDFVARGSDGKPFRLSDHQRTILRKAFMFNTDGKLPYSTIIYSCVKKSGKTEINAIVVLWWAFTQEASNEILLLANDQEQAQGRVFKTIRDLLRHNPRLQASAQVRSEEIRLTNGTTITALAQDYPGAAGSKHGLTSWDELWGYSHERAVRLWEEMTPIATRTNSIRFVTTYAGFENESELLWRLYLQGVGKDEHPDGQGTRLDPHLPIYANDQARIFTYWDHERRMPWQTPEYYETERQTLRPATFMRLHENKWGATETSFITEAMWRACVDPGVSQLLPAGGGRRTAELFVGVDVGVRHDSSAVVAVRRQNDDKLVLARHRIWRPGPSEDVQIKDIEAFLCDLRASYHVRQVLVDPHQGMQMLQTLKAKGVPVLEFPQTIENLTSITQVLYDCFKGRNLRLYEADDLRAHVLNAVVVESSRGQRIAKEKASKKVDGAVALAMACYAAIARPKGSAGSVTSIRRDRITGEVTFFRTSRETAPENPLERPVIGYSERGDMPRPPAGYVRNRRGQLEPYSSHPHGEDPKGNVWVQCLACGVVFKSAKDLLAREQLFLDHWRAPHPKHQGEPPPVDHRYGSLRADPGLRAAGHDVNDPVHRTECRQCRAAWKTQSAADGTEPSSGR